MSFRVEPIEDYGPSVRGFVVPGNSVMWMAAPNPVTGMDIDPLQVTPIPVSHILKVPSNRVRDGRGNFNYYVGPGEEIEVVLTNEDLQTLIASAIEATVREPVRQREQQPPRDPTPQEIRAYLAEHVRSIKLEPGSVLLVDPFHVPLEGLPRLDIGFEVPVIPAVPRCMKLLTQTDIVELLDKVADYQDARDNDVGRRECRQHSVNVRANVADVEQERPR